MTNPFESGSGYLPLIAILRGLPPEKAVGVGQTLIEAGFGLLEVPLNRPHAVECIGRMARGLPADVRVGGGTVLSAAAVDQVASVGGTLIVSPDCNPAVIRATCDRGLWSVPGAATPTEALRAIDAGAHAVKAFPAEGLAPVVIKSWRAVIPANIPIYPVGGITAQRIAEYRGCGVNGFGLGGALYSPEYTLDELKRRARELVAAFAAWDA